MIRILQWGLERSICRFYTLDETNNPIYNQDAVLLVDNQTIVNMEELGYKVLTETRW